MGYIDHHNIDTTKLLSMHIVCISQHVGSNRPSVHMAAYMQFSSFSTTWLTQTLHSVPISCTLCQTVLTVSTSEKKYRFGVPFKVSKLDCIWIKQDHSCNCHTSTFTSYCRYEVHQKVDPQFGLTIGCI